MKYAVIDLGTNSARLMLAHAGKDGVRALSKRLITCRVGEGLSRTGAISDEAAARTVKALGELLNEAREQNAQVFAFATSAIREAVNGREFVEYVKTVCGLDIDVISGEKEAECGFAGAAGLSGALKGIIDIGGGSTEIMAGDSRVFFVKSFKIGTVRSLADYEGSGYGALERLTRETLSPAVPQKAKGIEYIGVGGTATALASIALALKKYDPAKVQGYALALEKLSAMADELRGMSVDERKKLDGLDEGRADVIAYGATILESAMRALEISRITVSDRDGMEGYLELALKSRGCKA